MTNPLLELAPKAQLPRFDAIRPEHAEPAIAAVLAQNRRELAELLARAEAPTWESLLAPLEEMDDRLSRVWAPIGHLFAVDSTPEWRKAFNACLPKVTEYGLELSHNEALFRAYEQLAQSAAFETLSPARKKIVRDALRDFRLSGIALPPDQKARFKELTMRLSELGAKFEENLLDATQAWSKHVTDESALTGMTESGKAAAAEKARAKNLDGWLLTLDFPSFDAVITYADDRGLREEIYRAYCTRASDQGPQAGRFDNTALMEEMLRLRHEEAQLLGYRDFAEVSLETKMAESPDAVERFLLDLAGRAQPRAQAELDDLAAFARTRGCPETLQPWDVAYYAEKLKHEKLGLSDEILRPYFPLPQVLRGMFALAERLYGVKIEQTNSPQGRVPVWHRDVGVYRILDAGGDQIARFYLDSYARDDKRGGAWMDECITRRRNAHGVQQPVAFLVCNFSQPLGSRPALLTHEEVLTLFHEFGHALQHLLTRVEEASVSGIHGIEWDAVELPSQFMENWCFEREPLALFARHYATGEPLPDDVLARLRASRTFHAGLATVRQIEFALFDLRLHRDYDPSKGARIAQTLAQVRDEVAVLKPPAYNRFPNSFSHIFGGGYAAGYYSYKWAEVLSADAFGAFEEAGLFDAKVGARFRDTILAQGGSREAMELFVEFRGREPSIEPLLRQCGLSG